MQLLVGLQGGDLASFGDKEEEESWHTGTMFYSSILWIGFRQYDGEGTEGQVRGRGELAHWDHVLQLCPEDWVQAVRWGGDRGPGM
jgi:hypothetical protein